jgi:hypothetical protein
MILAIPVWSGAAFQRGEHEIRRTNGGTKMQILRLRLALNYPSDEDLSLGTPAEARQTPLKDDKSNYALKRNGEEDMRQIVSTHTLNPIRFVLTLSQSQLR